MRENAILLRDITHISQDSTKVSREVSQGKTFAFAIAKNSDGNNMTWEEKC